jgi:hypothetical protein
LNIVATPQTNCFTYGNRFKEVFDPENHSEEWSGRGKVFRPHHPAAGLGGRLGSNIHRWMISL